MKEVVESLAVFKPLEFKFLGIRLHLDPPARLDVAHNRLRLRQHLARKRIGVSVSLGAKLIGRNKLQGGEASDVARVDPIRDQLARVRGPEDLGAFRASGVM